MLCVPRTLKTSVNQEVPVAIYTSTGSAYRGKGSPTRCGSFPRRWSSMPLYFEGHRLRRFRVSQEVWPSAKLSAASTLWPLMTSREIVFFLRTCHLVLKIISTEARFRDIMESMLTCAKAVMIYYAIKSVNARSQDIAKGLSSYTFLSGASKLVFLPSIRGSWFLTRILEELTIYDGSQAALLSTRPIQDKMSLFCSQEDVGLLLEPAVR